MFAALLAAIAAPSLARADWEELAGIYSGPWKSADTDGTSYSDKATCVVNKLILGSVTGAGKATAGGKNGKLTGSAPLYTVGTATLTTNLQVKTIRSQPKAP